jgi:hypothetical protein
VSEILNGIHALSALNRWLRGLDLTELAEIVLAPDLARLAAICDRPDSVQAGLWVTSLGEQALSPLVTSQAVMALTSSVADATLARPRWSADGQWLAFTSHQGWPPGQEHRLWAVPMDAGASLRLLYKGRGNIAAHLWSPDGSCLAVADSGAGLVIAWLGGTSQVIDSEAMRYPLGENAMAWLDGGQRLLYMNLSPDQAGLWQLEWPAGQKRRVVSLPQDEIMIPVNVNEKDQMAWGALRGHTHERRRGAVLYFWTEADGQPKAIPLPNVEFDPGSSLLPNKDGSLWAFTVWRDGRRVSFVVDRPASQGRALTAQGDAIQMLGWSDNPRRLWILHPLLQLVGLDVDQANAHPPQEEVSFSVNLTSAELVYLLEILEAQSIVGLTNPLAKIPEDEASKLREATKTALISKGYVSVLSDGQLQIDLTIAALVQCCASPERTWTITFEKVGGKRDVRHVHLAQNLIVEDAIQASDTHQLTPLRDDTAALQRIEQQLGLNKQPAAPCQPFTLREEIFFRVREVAAALGEETASRYLTKAGVPEATAAVFAQTLTQPVSNSSVSCWPISGQKETTSTQEGLGVLEGPVGLWLLWPFVTDDTVWIKVSPGDATAARQQLATLFSHGVFDDAGN